MPTENKVLTVLEVMEVTGTGRATSTRIINEALKKAKIKRAKGQKLIITEAVLWNYLNGV